MNNINRNFDNIESTKQFEQLLKISSGAFSLTGAETIYNEIKHLEPNQYLIHKKKDKTLHVINYNKFKHGDFYNCNETELIRKLDNIFLNVFKRIIKSLNNRTLVIPLSGRCDSRCIAIML